MSWNAQYGIDPNEIKAFMAEFGDRQDLPARLAANVVNPMVQTEVNDAMIAPLFLETRPLMDNEDSSLVVEDDAVAVIVDEDGSSIPQKRGKKKIQLLDTKVDCLLIFETRDLRHGLVRPLTVQGDEAISLVKEQIDAYCLNAALTAVPAANTVACSGGVLTLQAMRSALAIIKHQKLKAGYIIADPIRVMGDMADFSINSNEVKDEFARRGVTGTWGGAGVAETISIADNNILLVGNKLVGKCLIVDGPVVEPYYNVQPGQIGQYVQMTVRIGVGLPSKLSRIVIS